MAEEIDLMDDMPVGEESSTGKYDRLMAEQSVSRLTGMFKNWFLDYASYVILERAVPHIDDGLKPVQRRILHAMKVVDDGRYNKVANVVGQTMQYHPHGDQSIGAALVQMGQKDLLIDCQGNWGNILTGDPAAAPRYIEARLSKFALEVVFNRKTTEWMLSYDGRKEEPVALPVKFPLLLAQGTEGIAVGLASKILPHNFNELISAAIAHLKGEPFVLYPDFPTGGMIDVSRYNDGLRGGAVKVRAKISKVDKSTLVITEIPFSITTETLKESITKAQEKGKIKIKNFDDNTASTAEIVVHVASGESCDKTIDALYAFTLCEISLSPNSCVIKDKHPEFMGVSDILRHSTEHTKELLRQELEIHLGELNDQWHKVSLERIFIENKIYQVLEGKRSIEQAHAAVAEALKPFTKLLRREIDESDIEHLVGLPFIRISRFNLDKADNEIKRIDEEIAGVKHDLAHLVEYTIAYFEHIREKYGKGRERLSEIRSFDIIDSTKVAASNAKLYVDRKEGFFGIGKGMKDAEYVCDCSDIDDVIIILRDGRYIIKKVEEKSFFDKDIIYIGVFKRNDERTIYNVLYRDGGKNGPILMKRCAIKGITRDKEYNLTKGTPKSEILHLTVNPNGEAEVLKIYFKPRPRLKKVIVDLDFATIAIKGRQSQGNLFSRYAIHKIAIKKKGTSTLSAQEIFWDDDIRRLNSEGRGRSLGMFKGEDKIVVWTAKHQYYITGFDTSQHFPEDTIMVEKYNASRIYNLCYFDREQGYYYMKRFQLDMTDRLLPFLDEEGNADFVAICSRNGSTLRITYKGNNATRPADEIAVDEFVGVKSRKAKGKRLTTYDVDTLTFIEPEEPEEPEEEIAEEADMAEGAEEQTEEIVTPVLMTEDEEYSASQLDLFS